MAEYPAIQRKIDEAVAAAVEPMRDELTRLRAEVADLREVLTHRRDVEFRAATVLALLVPNMAPPEQEPIAGLARSLYWPWTAARA